ncbi:glycoside hydrolase family 18 protein [Moniliophthora roreri]|nr:glycoside hydrolase family 18 protein [Moniliophthora roreri]
MNLGEWGFEGNKLGEESETALSRCALKPQCATNTPKALRSYAFTLGIYPIEVQTMQLVCPRTHLPANQFPVSESGLSRSLWVL